MIARATGRWKLLCTTLLATAAAVLTIIGLRRIGNSPDLLGSIPANLEWPGVGVIAVATLATASIIILVSSPTSSLRWARLPVGLLVTIAAVMASFMITQTPIFKPLSSTKIINEIVRLEVNQHSLHDFDAQSLSFYLTVVGRESEAQQFVERDLKLPGEDTENLLLHAEDWKEAISRIAKRERIVIIMEDHHTPMQREWIEQSLKIFRDAGFNHFAAEGISEWSTSLTRRGYPISTTGHYTCDPSFGNLLRRAVSLDFELHEYDVTQSDIAKREEGQAAALAKLFASNPDCKLLIHSGPGHAEKVPKLGSIESMAARLWKMTGVEPFCILQSSPPSFSENNVANYRKVLHAAQVDSNPKVIRPLPAWLLDHGLHAHAFDAYVVHPMADTSEPTLNRQPLFQDGQSEIQATWKDSTDIQYPIVIGIYVVGEPANAIAVDQLMLRKSDISNGEVQFKLWTTHKGYEIRAHSLSGPMDVVVEQKTGTKTNAKLIIRSR